MKVKLGDAFDLQMGKTPARNDNTCWGRGHKWISISDIGNAGKYIDTTKEEITDIGVSKSGIKVVPKGTVIMSFKLSIGKTSITAEDMYTNEAIIAFIDKGRYEINTDYLYHLCKGIDWLEGTNKAVLGLTLNKATMSEKEINIPPVEEQLYVVSVLDKMDELIALRKEQLAKLDQLVKSRFIELFGDCKNEVLIGDVISISRGASPRPISAFITDKEDGVNWIKIGDVSESSLYITKTEERITSEGAKKSRMVHKGDFILSNSMSFGRPYILGIDGCVHDGWLIMSDFKETFNELYLYHAIRSEDVQYQFSGKVNGATVKNLNSDLVKNTFIKVPPMELQEQFANFVEQTDKSKLVIQQSLDKLELLKKSLMQEYFG